MRGRFLVTTFLRTAVDFDAAIHGIHDPVFIDARFRVDEGHFTILQERRHRDFNDQLCSGWVLLVVHIPARYHGDVWFRFRVVRGDGSFLAHPEPGGKRRYEVDETRGWPIGCGEWIWKVFSTMTPRNNSERFGASPWSIIQCQVRSDTGMARFQKPGSWRRSDMEEAYHRLAAPARHGTGCE